MICVYIYIYTTANLCTNITFWISEGLTQA